MRKADDFRKTKLAYLQKKKTSVVETRKQVGQSPKQGHVLQVEKTALPTPSTIQSRTKPQMTIDSFANEIIFKIFSYLDVKSLLSCASTCRRWEAIANDNSFWKFWYVRYVYVPPKGVSKRYIKEPAAPLEVKNKYWKTRFMGEAKAARNERFTRLRKISSYTGVTDRVKDVLEKLGAKFQLCVTAKKGAKFTLIERKRSVFITSTTVQWYTLKPTPKLSEIVRFEIFSLTPIITQKDGFMLRSGPRSKNLVFAENVDTAKVFKQPHFQNNQLEIFITEAGLFISVWKGTEEIAFVWAMLHHHNLLYKCLKSTSVVVYQSPHILKPDDVTRLYGLQGYKIHLQVISGDALVWDALYETDTMSSCRCSDTMVFTKNNLSEGFPTAALDSLSLSWKTDVFNGKLENLLLMSITVTDINADVLWKITRPVICESTKLEAANFHSVSDMGVQISHCDKVGRLEVNFHAIPDGGYAVDSLRMHLNLIYINSWFGTKH